MIQIKEKTGIQALLKRFEKSRKESEKICELLVAEDYSAQPVVYVSPPKWHLAHTIWFFEQFVLLPYLEGYEVYDDDFAYLFNSYYNNAGERVLRPNRGLMTRPKVEEIFRYRAYVTDKVRALLQREPHKEVLSLIEVSKGLATVVW